LIKRKEGGHGVTEQRRQRGKPGRAWWAL